MKRAAARAWCALQHHHMRWNEGYRRVRFCRICDRRWTRILHRHERDCPHCFGRGGFDGNGGMWLNCPHCAGYTFERAKENLSIIVLCALGLLLLFTLWRVS